MKIILQLWAKAYKAAFSSVMLPKAIFLDNSGLAITHRLMLLSVAVGVYSLMRSTKNYLIPVVPQGYATVWASGDAAWETLVGTEMSGADHCLNPNKYAFWGDDSFVAKDFNCIHPAHFSDGEVNPIRGSETFVTTYFEEDWYERQTENDACAETWTACNSGSGTFVDDGGNAPCTCDYPDKHYFTTGASEQLVYMEHSMTVDDPTGELLLGYQSKTKELAEAAGTDPIMTVIQMYDKDTGLWKEADCSSTATQTQAEGECRFYGDVIGMRLSEWLSIADPDFDFDHENKYVETNTETTYSATPLKTKPTYRLTGAKVVVQMEYLDKNLHSVTDFDDGGNTKKRFPGTVCSLKLTLNPQWTLKKRNIYTEVPSASNMAGKMRSRSFSGIHFTISNSSDSEYGFFSFAGVASALAVSVVYFQGCTQGIMLVALYLLGNTSRNYQRSVREHCNVAIQAARRTPPKMFQAAVTFFFMREWEKEPDKMKALLEDPTPLAKSTVNVFIRRCFDPDIVGDLTEDDLDNFVDACWHEMGGDIGDGVNMPEFLECCLAGDVVDYYASKQAFNLKRPKNPIEKIFGDNVKSYHHAKKKPCWGLLDPPGTDKAREKMRNVFNTNSVHSAKLSAMGHEAWKEMMHFEHAAAGVFGKFGAKMKGKKAKVQPDDTANMAGEECDFNVNILPEAKAAWS